MKFTRIDSGTEIGYRSADGRVEIFDNGGGMGPSKDSGRWALEIDGRWIANLDTLAAAKTAGEQETN